MRLVEWFCHVDDFCKGFQPKWEREQLTSGVGSRQRAGLLSLSEIMTIVIHFHQSGYRTFKTYYIEYVQGHLHEAFPNLVSYARFVRLKSRVIGSLSAYLYSLCGTCTGVSFVDSTPLAVCHNQRITQHRVFEGLAARGKTSMGWFYGFKLHLVVNDRGQLLTCKLTPGNTNDRQPVPALAKGLNEKLFGDRGYLSKKLMEQLWKAFQVQVVTKLRKNMKNQVMLMMDKLLLRKRAIIETIIDQLKNISQIEHSRHRSPANFVVKVLAGLIAYAHRPVKPAISWTHSALSVGLIQN